MAESQSYDLVILGATGFTGQFVLEEVLRETSSRKDFRVAVAGRNKDKLLAGLEAAGKITGIAVDKVAVQLVDVSNQANVERLASMTKMLVSCVGPYREHGLAVAEACVLGGADLVDISGEPQYLEAVQEKLAASAAKAGVHIVGSCGFDSVPADMGTLFLQDNFPGELSYVEMVAGHGNGDGAVVHATTLQCAVLGYANRAALRANRAKIMPTKLALPSNKPPKRGVMWWSTTAQQWCVANIGSDRSVVTRSQHLLHQLDNKPPVHFAAYFGVHSLLAALKAALFALVFLAMSSMACTRDMLIKWPEVFTLGMFSWAGPEREDLRNLTFCVTLTGTGSSDGAPVVRHCRVRGPDPGYLGTALLLVQCALTALDEKEKLPSRGGVFTPAAAFRHTSLISRLQARGVSFSMGHE